MTTANESIDPITFDTFETIANHSMLSFQEADSRFNDSAALHPAPQTLGDSSSLTLVNMNLNIFAWLVGVPVAYLFHLISVLAGLG